MNFSFLPQPRSGVLDAPMTEVFRPMFRRAWRVFGLSLVTSLLVLAPSVYMLEVYDRVVNSRNLLTLVMLTVIVVLAFAVMELLEWVRSETLQEIGQQADSVLSPRLFRLVFEANLRRMPGGTVQTMNDWRLVRDFIHSPFVLALMELPVSLVFLALVFLINPLLGWVTLGFAVLQTLLAWVTHRATQPPLAAANRAAVQAQQYADASLRNAEVIEAMGMIRQIFARWIKRQRDFLGQQAQASRAAGGLQAISKLLQQVVSSALLGLAAWLLLKNELHGGAAMMIVASIIGGRVLTPVVQMIGQWQSALNVQEAWRRLNALLYAFPERDSSMPLPAPTGHLVVEQLVTGAPALPGQPSQPILRGIQFAANPGEVVTLIGPSASGKTTLARALVGLWPAIAGKVRLDGADVFQWNKAELGPHIGYLPQGVELFEGTVAENIARFGDVNTTLVEAAARAAGMHEIILALPQGYDTPVGREGAVLSGGQRQRVGLARALYGEPAFVVLDEPNSSLDEAGDAALVRTLGALKARKATVVVASHRASVLPVTDKLLVLRDGMQQAFGPRDEVLAALKKAQQQPQQAVQPGRGLPVGGALAVAGAGEGR